jgi:NAD-dependent deacetylase
MLDSKVRDLIEKSFRGGNIVCLTGAGVSRESGIPTFRGKGGLWEKYDPQTYAYPKGLLSLLRDKPQDLADFIADFYTVLLQARPNPAHLTLAVLEKEGILRSVITQNIDNLHQQAGSRNVIELHGNAFRIICPGCRKRIILESQRLKEFTELIKVSRASRIQLLRILCRYFPRCTCGLRYRIDVVLFGETLPEDALSQAYKELGSCNLLFVIGSSLVVYPAAGLPLYAKERGAKIIEINEEPSALSQFCDYRITGKASEILPQILEVAG